MKGGVEHDLHVDRVTGAVTRHRIDGDDSGGSNSGSSGRGRGWDD